MKVRVKLNGPLRIGRYVEQVIHLPEGSRVQHIVEYLQVEETRIGIAVRDNRVVALDVLLADGDEILFFPFVSGG